MGRLRYSTLLLILAGLVILGLAGAGLFTYLGIYNFSALEQHTKPVFWLIDQARTRSVAVHARDIEVPDLSDPDWQDAGFALYNEHCVQCHGAPGISPEPFALGMDPVPTAIVGIAHKRHDFPQQMYWVIANGIRMTGMPAWRYRLTETQIWQLVAFLEQMPYLSVAQYQAYVERYERNPDPFIDEAASLSTAEPPLDEREEHRLQRGREAIQQYGCTSCHAIPGLTSAENDVGPPLAGIADRSFIGGVIPNNDENMVRWLQDPPAVAPLTLMPDLGVEEDDAIHIAAYLSTLGEGRRGGVFGEDGPP